MALLCIQFLAFGLDSELSDLIKNRELQKFSFQVLGLEFVRKSYHNSNRRFFYLIFLSFNFLHLKYHACLLVLLIIEPTTINSSEHIVQLHYIICLFGVRL